MYLLSQWIWNLAWLEGLSLVGVTLYMYEEDNCIWPD